MTSGAADVLAGFVFQPAGFGWVGAAVVLVGVGALASAYTFGLRWSRYSRAGRMRLLGLRLGAVLCLVLAILHPTWVREYEASTQRLVAIVLDDSESMSCPISRDGGKGEANGDGPTTRYARATAIVRDQLMPALRETHQLALFDVEGRRLADGDLPKSPTGRRSALTETLSSVERDVADEPVVGIVLVSDGAEISDRPGTRALERLRAPVYTIDLGSGKRDGAGPSNLTIQAVSANRRALVGNTVKVQVDLRWEGARATAGVPVSIFDGKEMVASRMISWPAERSSARAELEFVPRKAGEFTYVVQVGAGPNEGNLEDNREMFPLSVRAKPLVVVYVDGVLRWEGKFTRQALAHDPDISVVSSVRTVRPGADHGSQGLLLPKQLANVDVVILGDVEASFFSRDELSALDTWVTEGGGLLLTGGYRCFGPEGFGRTLLRQVLPVVFSAAANPQIEQPFQLKLTEEGQESPIFHLTSDAVRDTAFFQSLPPLGGCSRIAAVKPAAQVLAVHPNISGPEDGRGLPVMVQHQVGLGRTMVFAVDTTWRWRMVVGGFTGDSSFYQRFWGQVVRFLANDEETGPPLLALSTDRYRYDGDQEIHLKIGIRRRGPTSQPSGAARGERSEDRPGRWNVTAVAMDEKGSRKTIPLAELEGLTYAGTLRAPGPGRVDLLVRAEPVGEARADEQVVAQSQAITVQVARPNPEMQDPRPNPQWLAQVAQCTGGRFLDPDQVKAWASGLESQPVQRAAVQKTSLWRHPVLAGAFFAMLCSEWILRRRNRLA